MTYRLPSGLLALAFVAGAARAETLYRPFKSAYYLGRADTGIAAADDHEAIYYNPAGLATGKGIYKETVLLSPQIDVSADTKDLARKVLVEKDTSLETFRSHVGKNQHVGLQNVTAVVFRRAALGFLSANETDILVSKDPNEGGLEKVSARAASDQILTLSVAETLVNDSLYVGLTGKYMMVARAGLDVNVIEADDLLKKLKEDDVIRKGRGSGADLGILWRQGGKESLSLGLTIENVGNITVVPDDENHPVPPIKQSVNAGIAFEKTVYLSSFKLLADVRDLTSRYDNRLGHKLFLGGEISVKGFVGMTAGLYKGYTTAGLYADLWVVRADVGTYVEEIGPSLGLRPDRRYFFRLSAGF